MRMTGYSQCNLSGNILDISKKKKKKTERETKDTYLFTHGTNNELFYVAKKDATHRENLKLIFKFVFFVHEPPFGDICFYIPRNKKKRF